MAENTQEARKDPSIKYDEAWCVFDRDDHSHFLNAISAAHSANIKTAPSNPSFELWLYLHFQDPPGQCDQGEMADRLKKHVPDYEKHVDFERYLAGYQSAIKRADRTISESTESGKGPHGNPTTHVQSLTRAILGPA